MDGKSSPVPESLVLPETLLVADIIYQPFETPFLKWARRQGNPAVDVYKRQDKLYMTYYPDDKDSYNRWIEVGVDPSHLIPIEDNFWEIGAGPSGPDTEIFFDRGEAFDPENIGIRLLAEDIENDRYIEIWNIVLSPVSYTHLDVYKRQGKCLSEESCLELQL